MAKIRSVRKDLKKPAIIMGFLFYVTLTFILSALIGNIWAALSFALAAYSVL